MNSAAVANGGTGRATLDTGKVLIGAGTSQVDMLAGTTTNDVLLWSGSAWISSPAAAAGAGGGYQMTVNTTPSSYTKPASLKAIKVTVIGSGGNGGAISGSPTLTSNGGGGGAGGAAIYYAPAPSLPASSIPIIAGTGTNSFGAIVSATAGGNSATVGGGGQGIGGAGGTGSGGSINITGQTGSNGNTQAQQSGMGGSSLLGQGGLMKNTPSQPNSAGNNGTGYGSGGSGATRSSPSTATISGGTGTPGIVIIEEFF